LPATAKTNVMMIATKAIKIAVMINRIVSNIGKMFLNNANAINWKIVKKIAETNSNAAKRIVKRKPKIKNVNVRKNATRIVKVMKTEKETARTNAEMRRTNSLTVA